MTKKPSIFIIGTMKGGTTALYDHLCEHPLITGGAAKEIHYFTLHKDKGVGWYNQQFANVPQNHLTIDASPTYFDMAESKAIPTDIKAYVADPKIFLIIRDPIARAVSHFYHLKKVVKIGVLQDVGLNDFFGRDFAQLLVRGPEIDRHLLSVIKFSDYHHRYMNYLTVFSKKAVQVFSNMELLNKPKETMLRACEFIGVEPHISKKFGAFKHSNGSNVDELSDENFEKLRKLFYPNFKKFCAVAGLDFEPLRREVKPPISAIHSPPARTPTKSVDPDVHLGHEGWMFLTGGSNNVLDYYTERDKFSSNLKGEWWTLLHRRRKRLKEIGCQYLHILAPEKLSVYPEFFNGKLPCFDERPGASLKRHELSDGEADFVIDPTAYFQKLKREHPLYWKTDTHWTFWGAFGAYQLICSCLSLPFKQNLHTHKFSNGPVLFDLGGKLDPPLKEPAQFWKISDQVERTYRNCLVEYQETEKVFGEINLHRGTHVIYKNRLDDALKKKVVIFGDSFSEYRPHLLTGILANTFSELHFIWSSSIDFDYIESVKPDIVISEIAERFITRGPVPDDKLKIEDYSIKRLREYKQSILRI